MNPAMSSDGNTGQSWRPHRLDQQSLADAEKWLQAACYVVCAYLTGMRDSEVQAMQAGCHAVARSADGLVERHRVHSTAYKLAGAAGQFPGLGHDRARRPRHHHPGAADRPGARPARHRQLWIVLKGGSATKDHLSSEIVRTLNQFRDHLDSTRGGPSAPAVPQGSDKRPWHFSTRQFRRTVAWHIANRPFGTVAGKIQYKHASIATFEGYGGESASGFQAEIERERAIGQLDDIIEHYEDFRRGLTPTGPASARILREFARVRDELGDLRPCCRSGAPAYDAASSWPDTACRLSQRLLFRPGQRPLPAAHAGKRAPRAGAVAVQPGTVAPTAGSRLVLCPLVGIDR